MVKSLKFLRHRRTDAGYFSEFLIAKSPNDVENREPQQRQQIVLTAALPVQQAQPVPAASAIEPQLWPAVHEIVIPASASSVQPPLPQPARPRSAANLDSYRLARRRERNRAAAAKCRQRRQDRLEYLAECVRELEAENGDLEAEVAELAAARARLESELRTHQPHCQLSFSPTAVASVDAFARQMLELNEADDSQLSSSPLSPSTSVWLTQPQQQQQPAVRRPASLSLMPPSAPSADVELPSLTTPRAGGAVGGGIGSSGSGLTPFLLTPQSALKLESVMQTQ